MSKFINTFLWGIMINIHNNCLSIVFQHEAVRACLSHTIKSAQLAEAVVTRVSAYSGCAVHSVMLLTQSEGLHSVIGCILKNLSERSRYS